MSIRAQRNSLPLLCLDFKKDLLVEDWYEDFRDDFDDAIIRPEWITHGTGPDRTIIEAAGVETLAITNNVDARWWWNFTNNAPKMYVPLDVLGPCRITAKLNSQDGDPAGTINNCVASSLFIGTDPEGESAVDALVYRWGRYRYDAGPYDGILVRSNIAFWAEEAIGGRPPYCPLWLRLNITADGSVHFEYSFDGINWLEYSHLVLSGYDIANSFVGINVENRAGTFCTPFGNTLAEFEYFLIEKYEAQHPIDVECLAPIDTRAPETFYHGRIKQMSSLKRAVDDKTGLFQASDLSITLANEDKHYSQKMANHFLKNQEAILYHAWTEEAEALKTEIIKLIADDHSLKGPDFIIKFKDITQKYFTKKVPENICTKDEFPDIHPEYEGWCMPEILGNASLLGEYEYEGAVQAVYVDTNGPPYRCLASAGLITIPTDEVWIGTTQKTTPGDYTVVQAGGRTYIHFVAGQDPGDETVAFNAHGYSVPVWDSVNGYVQNLAYIIQYYLRFMMDIPHSLVNSPSFLTLASYYEDMGVEENGYLILQDRVDAMETLRQLLFTGGAKGFMAMDGKFNVQRKNVCNWEIDTIEHHIFEQIELFGSPERQWNLTSAVNTVNAKFGYKPWQNLYTSAVSEYVDNDYGAIMEDDLKILPKPPIGRERP